MNNSNANSNANMNMKSNIRPGNMNFNMKSGGNSKTGMNQNERGRMLREVQSIDFALHETALFLDINPNDTTAIEYFNRCKKLADEARERFESRFGPLTAMSQKNIEHWKWTDAPWPWEYSEGRSM